MKEKVFVSPLLAEQDYCDSVDNTPGMLSKV
jgi:hypothetical protein